MALLPLVLSIGGSGCGVDARSESAETPTERRCRYCGAPAGHTPNDFIDGAASACTLCGLALHLERPRIADEARLIWLPEMSQAALSVVMRRLHTGLRGLGERLEASARPSLAVGELPLLYHAQQGLLDRSREAEVRFGSSDPSELADALARLSRAAYAHRGALLGGLRLLPLGRLFAGAEDIYPAVVDSWRKSGTRRQLGGTA
jgi:intracellular multiplication protein IcmJ